MRLPFAFDDRLTPPARPPKSPTTTGLSAATRPSSSGADSSRRLAGEKSERRLGVVRCLQSIRRVRPADYPLLKGLVVARSELLDGASSGGF